MSGTFSESWYRVSEVRTALRPTVHIRKQLFRGEWWYVLHDVFNNAFFRLRPESYAFISRLNLSQTVDEVWLECIEADPDNAPGQVVALQLLTKFNNDNLLYFDTPTDSGKLYSRQQSKKKQELRSKLMSFFFLRMSLIDPNQWLDRIKPIYGVLFSWVGMTIWLLVLMVAGNVLVGRIPELAQQSSSVLAPNNLLLLYFGMVLAKFVHEFGHAATCKHYGGEVHNAGVMFVLFTPMPYVDATSSWGFRSRWQRMMVASAGMIFELFVAALAALVWAYSAPGVINGVAYNLMFSASIATVVFNLNPLMKFDGYFIFTDLLDLPNLQTHSRSQLRYLSERYLFGVQELTKITNRIREAAWYVAYGIGSAIYKVFLTSFIVFFVMDEYLVLGLFMGVVMLFQWLVVPPYKFLRYLFGSSKLTLVRGRAIGVSLFLLVTVVSLSSLISIPNFFKAPGITESTEFYQVLNPTPGEIVEIVAKPGSAVKKGDPLIRLNNKMLEWEKRVTQAQYKQVLIQEKISRSRHGIQLESVKKRKLNIKADLARLDIQLKNLTVYARQSGIWMAPEVNGLMGSWLARGTEFGMILDPNHFRFVAVVSQEEAASLFEQQDKSHLEVRLNGRADVTIDVLDYQIIPFQKEHLPSAALGWMGGGEVAVTAGDGKGRQSLEPFFLIRAVLSVPSGFDMLHGHSGKLRVSMEPQPLWEQLERKLRQFLQQRYSA
ncbi:MAG: biotin/lipoyl-binding protein [Magnetococcales bacterium]|nr:biotin/lipoyl-binding protein [Magnetococcales bacterium]